MTALLDFYRTRMRMAVLEQLQYPVANYFYMIGMKSYGRAPTFLAMTGYEQVRSVVAMLAGDSEAAARVELALPDTGVCGGSGLYDEPEAVSDGGCCGATPELVQLGAGPVLS